MSTSLTLSVSQNISIFCLPCKTKTYIDPLPIVQTKLVSTFLYTLIPAINISTFSNHVQNKPVSTFFLGARARKKKISTFSNHVRTKPVSTISWTLMSGINISTFSNQVQTKPVSIVHLLDKSISTFSNHVRNKPVSTFFLNSRIR